MLRDTCNWIFAGQTDMLRSIGTTGCSRQTSSRCSAAPGDVTMYDLVRGVWQAAILPIGCGMLSFVFTVQLIKVSQRMDGNASMPGVKEVVFMLVFFAVFLFLIQNSFDLMQAVYQVVQLAIDRVTGLFGAGSELDLDAVSITTTDDDVAALVAMLVVALVSWLVVIVAYVVALVVSWARAIQIYVMAAFSPIPLALVSLDETRQMGVGYLKNFAAVCLAGIIILVLLVSFPIVLGGLNAASVGRAGRRLHRRRAVLRAPVPCDVRAPDPLAREERVVGARHPGRVIGWRARRAGLEDGRAETERRDRNERRKDA